MNPKTFLVLNLALAFYNVGTIWTHEVGGTLAEDSILGLLTR